jgi:hypothetical protein
VHPVFEFAAGETPSEWFFKGGVALPEGVESGSELVQGDAVVQGDTVRSIRVVGPGTGTLLFTLLAHATRRACATGRGSVPYLGQGEATRGCTATVRGGHIIVGRVDETGADPRFRMTLLKRDAYGLSLYRRKKWEPLPFQRTYTELVEVMNTALAHWAVDWSYQIHRASNFRNQAHRAGCPTSSARFLQTWCGSCASVAKSGSGHRFRCRQCSRRSERSTYSHGSRCRSVARSH